MLELPQPDHLPCPECGASVERGDDAHECDGERRLDYLFLQERDGVERFDADLGAWLESPDGRFAAWLAERRR